MVQSQLSEGSLVRIVIVQIPKFDAKPNPNSNPSLNHNPNPNPSPNRNSNPDPNPSPSLALTLTYAYTTTGTSDKWTLGQVNRRTTESGRTPHISTIHWKYTSINYRALLTDV